MTLTTASLVQYQWFNVTTIDVGTKSAARLPVPFLTAVFFFFMTRNIIRPLKFFPTHITFTSYRTKSVVIAPPTVMNLNVASLLLLIFRFVPAAVLRRAISVLPHM